MQVGFKASQPTHSLPAQTAEMTEPDWNVPGHHVPTRPAVKNVILKHDHVLPVASSALHCEHMPHQGHTASAQLHARVSKTDACGIIASTAVSSGTMAPRWLTWQMAAGACVEPCR